MEGEAGADSGLDSRRKRQAGHPEPQWEPDQLTCRGSLRGKGQGPGDSQEVSVSTEKGQLRAAPLSRDGRGVTIKWEVSALKASGRGRARRQVGVPAVRPAGSRHRHTLRAPSASRARGQRALLTSLRERLADGLDHTAHASPVSAQPSALCPVSPLCRPTHRLRGGGLPSGPSVYTASTISIKVRHSVSSFHI